MIKHYFTSSLRHLLGFKLFSLINVAGLAVGLAASIIILFYVQSEWSYDDHWSDADHIYMMMKTEAGAPEIDIRLPESPAPALQSYFEGAIEEITELRKASFSEVTIGSNAFVENVNFVDQSFTSFFQFETLHGDLSAIHHNPNALAVSEDTARRWFGTADVVGERATVRDFFAEEGVDYNLVAVYRQAPGNSTLIVAAMAGYSGQAGMPANPEVYLKLASEVDPDSIRERLPDFVNFSVNAAELPLAAGQDPSEVFRYHLIRISDLYFHPTYCAAWNAAACGSPTAVAGFAIIAVLVLLTACANYVVLALAKAGQRAREVAMRKVVGAAAGNLIRQFLGEAGIILLAAVILALALVDVFLPFFSTLADVPPALNFGNIETYIAVFTLLAIVGLVAGLYPAIYSSRFHPAQTLQSNAKVRSAGFSRLHGALLLLQFSTSIGLLIATLIVFSQLLYTQRLDLGFNPNDLIQIAVGRPEVNARASALRQEVLNSPKIHAAALTGMSPGENGVVISDEYRATSLPVDEYHRIPTIPVGFGFFEALEMPLVVGRFFEVGRDRPESSGYDGGANGQEPLPKGSVILNETAVEVLGFSSAGEALNQTISSEVDGAGPAEDGERLSTVIGIVSDSQYRSLQREAGPEAFFLNTDVAFFLMTRFSGDGAAANAALEDIWRDVMGDAIFQSSFVSENLASVFRNERNQGVLLITFALLSIFISCLGLYGVTAFTVDRRSKEVAIRKIYGSSIGQVVGLFGWQFSRYILLANLIAWPAAFWAMLTWLQRFPYQIDTLLLVPSCVLAAFIALLIAWFTVAVNTVKMANANPVVALRYE